MVRLGAVAVALLALAQIFSLNLVKALLPLFRAEIEALDGDFRILDLELNQIGGSNIIRLRANLAYPMHVGDRFIVPFDSVPSIHGWYQVDLNAWGVLQSSLILLIVVFGWWYSSWRVLSIRLLIALPMLGGLLMTDAPLELLGNLQEVLLRQLAPGGFRPLFAWDIFLEGGGNAALALSLGALTVVWADRVAATHSCNNAAV